MRNLPSASAKRWMRVNFNGKLLARLSLPTRSGFNQIRAFCFGAIGIEAQSMVSNRKTFSLGNGFLAFFNFFVKKLFNFAAV